MSPGNQMRALTASKARPKSATIAAGKSFERRNDTAAHQGPPSCGKRRTAVGGALPWRPIR